jgi:hypothetical protein
MGAGDFAWGVLPCPHAAAALSDLKPVRDLNELVARPGGADCGRSADRRIANGTAGIVPLGAGPSYGSRPFGQNVRLALANLLAHSSQTTAAQPSNGFPGIR